ncbi:MAG: hypothetical protein IJA90_00370 [Peptococcaceae bacterium]|nr:hypothetical protein [Peptococcaceae bacterium]
MSKVTIVLFLLIFLSSGLIIIKKGFRLNENIELSIIQKIVYLVVVVWVLGSIYLTSLETTNIQVILLYLLSIPVITFFLIWLLWEDKQ